MVRPSVALVYPACHRGGGVERCVREVARALAGGYRVTFVGDRFDASGMDGVAFAAVGGRVLPGTLGTMTFRPRARAALRRGRYDVVISWGAECPPGDILAVASVHRAWLGQGRPVPTRFGALPNRLRYLAARHVSRLVMERSYFRERQDPAVVVLSDQNRSEVMSLYGVGAERIVTIPNGFAADEFDPRRARRARAERRGALGLRDEDVLILLVANELHRKGFATLLEAVAALADPAVHVAVVGRAGIDGYRPRIAHLGLQERVRWHGPSDDVVPWYGAADLFVMPSQYEAFPLVVVEALACGLPVITTAAAGSLDAVRPGVNGLLLHDPQDAPELTGLLRTGLDRDRRDSWRRAAPGSVAHLEWNLIAKRYAALIDERLRARGLAGERM